MASLKKAMQWDEEVFGLEYDLDIYMIVAVDDFNMGAMENKGLNVFNSKYVLAKPETATDTDYEGIEGVIAHEYFHNWTGNRVTCRDWFQLSLKEGLTVFRDQEFSADMQSRPVQRIKDVEVIRNAQFREDSGPMAHPVRPDSYMEINNFYTLTVYNKGAEVIRMLHTLLGHEGFRRGMDLYFKRHDGKAVTCDDFVAAMAAANDRDLTQFKLWYSQAGTPELKVAMSYDREKNELSLRVSQSCPPSPGQEHKKPFYMPLLVGLLAADGSDIAFRHDGEHSGLLILEQGAQEFCLQDVAEQPVLSLARNFSAPVKLVSKSSDTELAFRMAHDSDAFNRWDAGQQLALNYLLQGISRYPEAGLLPVPQLYIDAFAGVLATAEDDPAFTALVMALPRENWIGQQLEVIDPQALFMVRQSFRHQLAQKLRGELLACYKNTGACRSYRFTAEEVGRRSLRNSCLAYLLTPDATGDSGATTITDELLELGIEQYRKADNMTDVIAALAGVVNADRSIGDDLLADFYEKWREDPLVVDKWLILQAACTLPGTLERVQQLTCHSAFNLDNPNKVRSLIATFCSLNHNQFHGEDGAGYRFLADVVIKLDTSNPQIAARLLVPLTTWKRYETGRSSLMRQALEQIGEATHSRDVGEIVTKSLAN
jgi:aminopeptidase N